MLKPFEREEILFVVGKAFARAQRAALEPPVLDVVESGLVGTSAGMNEVHRMIRKVAPSTATVLLRGETGTGKELVAKALRDQSPRKDHPFVRVHCAALPDTLLESELFGYEKGAFTEAANRKPGRVELAHRGTLFLDEIGDISPQVQVKLLRVLQEREFERVGGTQTVKVDVRFVAATHRDLDALVAKGEFREDLYYRLNVVTLRVPPLRERGEDIEALAEHFLHVLGAANGKAGLALDRAGLQVLRAYSWPGNVRQLQNVMERLVVLGDRPIVGKADVERELHSFPGAPLVVSGAAGTPFSLSPRDSLTANSSTARALESSLDSHRRDAEKEALVRALARAGNNRTQAARLLNVSRRTLYNKLKEHGLD